MLVNNYKEFEEYTVKSVREFQEKYNRDPKKDTSHLQLGVAQAVVKFLFEEIDALNAKIKEQE